MDIKVLQNLSYGLYTIGTLKYGRKVGCVVNTVFQVSADPAMICVSMNKDNFTHDCIKEEGRFSVSILSEDTDPDIIRTFGFQSSEKNDKYDGFKYDYVDKMPVMVQDISGYLICEVVSFTEAGTHSLILAKVTNTGFVGKHKPMTYDYYHSVIKGKAPKNAPTYIAEEDKKEEAPKAEGKISYYCDVCGYVYEGDITKEPDDYKCPLCHMDKSHFVKVEEEPVEEGVSYYCDVCGYVYEGDITKEGDDYVCPLCGMDKSHFIKSDEKSSTAKKEEPKKEVKEEAPQSEETGVSYYCDICGYVYEGDITKEPDDYVCPLCAVDKSHFIKVEKEESKEEVKEEAPQSEETGVSYYCDICGYVYEGDMTKEPDDYECPLCHVDKSHFIKQ